MVDQLEHIAVGERLDRPQEAEGGRFSWADDSCELVISLSKLRPAEIRGIEHGVFEFGLNVVESVPFVCFRVFEVVGAKDFSQPQQGKVVLPIVILTDWPEMIVKVLRFFTLSLFFTHEVDRGAADHRPSLYL